MLTGTIKRVLHDKGFGFVKSGDTDYFFHRSGCTRVRFEELHEGEPIVFDVEESPKGPRATDLRRAD